MPQADHRGSDMGTTRKRVRRQRGSGMSPEIQALFEVGCAWNHYGGDVVKRLWDQYGHDYLATRTGKENVCFAELILGRPEKQEANQ